MEEVVSLKDDKEEGEEGKREGKKRTDRRSVRVAVLIARVRVPSRVLLQSLLDRFPLALERLVAKEIVVVRAFVLLGVRGGAVLAELALESLLR